MSRSSIPEPDWSAAALSPHDLAISSGDHGNVGVGGLATAGGIGWLVRTYGLTIGDAAAVAALVDVHRSIANRGGTPLPVPLRHRRCTVGGDGPPLADLAWLTGKAGPSGYPGLPGESGRPRPKA
jgi:hypothetical protein